MLSRPFDVCGGKDAPDGPDRLHPLLALAAAPAIAVPVDLELVLAVDVSGSMDVQEQALQRRGYAEAFLHPEVLPPCARALRPHRRDLRRVGRTRRAVGDGALDLGRGRRDGAADLPPASPRRRRQGCVAPRSPAPWPSPRPCSRPTATSACGVRSMSPATGPTMPEHRWSRCGTPSLPPASSINGLPLTLAPSLERAVGGPDLAAYYRDCVIGGPGAFVIPVERAGTAAGDHPPQADPGDRRICPPGWSRRP